jgi:CRISPR-associated endoribonuclease Cas6
MRVKLGLCAVEGREIPINYYYYLSSAIYGMLEKSSPEFSKFLHNEGYIAENKKYKLFTFALKFADMKPANDTILLNDRHITLFISFPDFNTFLENLVTGTIKSSSIYLGRTHFLIEDFDTCPEPDFTSNMKFTLLSPMVLSAAEVMGEKMKPHYLRHYEDINEQNRILTQNLRNKYLLVNNNANAGEVKLEWDMEYISAMEQKGKRLTKLIKIPKNGIDIYIKGNLIPFRIEGDAGLIKTGYECGFGDNNAMGFGMAQAI